MTRFEQQVLDVLPRLRRYALSLARDRADAEDLVQDCVERAFSRRTTWRGDNLQGWMMTILTNLNRNRVRSASAAPATVEIDEAEDHAAVFPDSDPLARDKLVAALNQLHPDQRAVLMLVVLEGRSYREVGEMLGIPQGTVMSRLSRARRSLASNLEGRNIVEFRRTP
ncbi:RNA polymerase sigma factor [Oricola sp.]|uniref:RNA polymerase sigma factor n=1 Tax=Oricola sp. TaxID=1979950 RepID=UPI003BABCFE2